MIYASNRSNNEISIEQSILFQIQISHSYHEYANIFEHSAFAGNEEEILFTMGAVFRIVSIDLNHGGFWEVKIRLNAEEDFELTNIAASLRREIASSCPFLSLGKLMFATANYDQAERFHLLALQELKISKEYDMIPAVYNGLGVIHHKIGKLNKAIGHYQNSLLTCALYLSPKDPEFAHVRNNLGMIYRQRDEYDKALLNYNKAMEIELNSLIPNTSETTIYHNNIGGVYFVQKRYSEALKEFKKCLQLGTVQVLRYPLFGHFNPLPSL